MIALRKWAGGGVPRGPGKAEEAVGQQLLRLARDLHAKRATRYHIT